MIKINNQLTRSLPEPLKLTFQKGHAAVLKYMAEPQKVGKPSFALKGGATPLYKPFHDKCAYCESKGRSVAAFDYDHFRPKGNAGDINGTISKLHYTWLMYSWDNLYLACPICNRNKANKFPVLKNRYKIPIKLERLEYDRKTLNEIEFQLFFDPKDQNPEQYFYYSDEGHIEVLPLINEFQNERCTYTIDALDLNRKELVERRLQVIQQLKTDMAILVRRFLDNGSAFKSPERKRIHDGLHKESTEYAGLQRFIIKKELNNNISFAKWASKNTIVTNEELMKIKKFFEANTFDKLNKDIEEKEPDVKVDIRISEIEICNFRAVKKLNLSMPTKIQTHGLQDEKWLVLIGENGTGKSTILQAIYGCLSDDPNVFNQHDFGDGGYIRINSNVGWVEVKWNDESGRPIWVRKNFKKSIYGYGPFRLGEDVFEGRMEIDTKASNLYDPLNPLLNTEKWMIKALNEGWFDKGDIKYSLLGLVSRDNTFDLKLISGEPTIVSNINPDHREPYSKLSTGYKQILTIACDIIKKSGIKMEEVASARGVVIIDEIENHLHPRWKTSIVTKLRNMFPLMQFIVSTHDPLCLNGLDAGETIMLRLNNDQELEHRSLMKSPSLLTSEQLLTSPFFGLESTYSEKTEKLFYRYQSLKLKEELDLEESQEIDLLEDELQDLDVIDSNFKDLMLSKLLNIYLEEKEDDLQFEVENLSEDTVKEAMELIEKHLG